jgi:GMP synthase-like glutamine amidotransferase
VTENILVVEHEQQAGLAFLGERLDQQRVRYTVVGPERSAAVPDSLDGYDGLIVLGGVTGPCDDDQAPWLPATRALLSQALKAGTPTLGVCLGAQMLAVVAGGRVDASPTPEIGVCELELLEASDNDPLLGSLPATVRAVQWHFLEIAELAPRAVRLASSARCLNQAFRVGNAAWGVQFHLEAGTQSVEDWGRESQQALADLGLSYSQLVSDTRQQESDLRHTWAATCDRFVEVVRSNTGSE